MKLAVSYDEQGNIVTLFDPEKLQGGDKVSIKYVPAEGENHVILEVPKELESRPFRDLPALLHVNASGARPRLEAKA
jgi:hypothetical protein